MTARLLSLAREAATSRGDARTAARLALTEALREERAGEAAHFDQLANDAQGPERTAWALAANRVGYLCADGSRAHTLRAAVRSWTAAATGRTPGQPGRPQTRAPAPPREPKTPRTSVTVRLPEDVLAWCRANGGVTAALERSVRAAMREAAAHDRPFSGRREYSGATRETTPRHIWKHMVLTAAGLTHEQSKPYQERMDRAYANGESAGMMVDELRLRREGAKLADREDSDRRVIREAWKNARVADDAPGTL